MAQMAREEEYHRAALAGEMGGDIQQAHATTDEVKRLRTALRKIAWRCNAALGPGRSSAVNEIADIAKAALKG